MKGYRRFVYFDGIYYVKGYRRVASDLTCAS